MIVSKFGGTSVADGAAIRRLAQIVAARAEERPVVVVSALAGVTDALLALASTVHAGRRDEVAAAVEALVAPPRGGRGGALRTRTMRWRPSEPTPRRFWTSLAAAVGRRLRPAELDDAGRTRRAVELAAGGRGDGGRSGCLPPGWTSAPIMVTDDRFGRATPYVQVLNDSGARVPRARCWRAS